MNKTMERRIADLERRYFYPRGLDVITILGGLPGEPKTASAGGKSWDREPGETLAAFAARSQ